MILIFYIEKFENPVIIFFILQIWITAKHQGKKTASYFWVGADVNISGIMPDIYHAYDG